MGEDLRGAIRDVCVAFGTAVCNDRVPTTLTIRKGTAA